MKKLIITVNMPDEAADVLVQGFQDKDAELLDAFVQVGGVIENVEAHDVLDETFDRMYPDARYLEHIAFEGADLFRSERLSACWNCGNMTHWVDTAFTARLCSPMCERKKWQEYEQAHGKDNWIPGESEIVIPDWACIRCHGDGEVSGQMCEMCQGSGRKKGR
jgi:hypothetical protein